MNHHKQQSETSYKHIIKYTGVFGGVQMLNIFIGLVRNKVVAQLLGPQGFGLVALFNSTVKFISDATSFGISTGAVREISKTYDRGDTERMQRLVVTLRTIELMTALLGIVVCVLFGGMIGEMAFSWGNHLADFIFLSSVVGCMAILGGELALLKATRQLKPLARQSIEVTILSLLVTLPLLYYMGDRGIIPMLIAIALIQMLTVLRYSCRQFPYRISLNPYVKQQAIPMLRLGLAFVVAGVMGSAVELAIRAFINKTDNLATLGLYNAGYMIVVTYAGMVFSAMETDYFPRLSGIKTLGDKLNAVVNRQMEVCFLIISPMAVAMIVALPLLLPLLFSYKFMPVMPMLQVAALSMYFRSLYLPVEYISLARGDWRSFILLEALSYGAMFLLMLFCFNMWRLLGCGICITAAYIIEAIVVYFYARRRFKFRASQPIQRFVLMQLPIGIVTFLVAIHCSGPAYWLIGIMLVALSTAISVYMFRRELHNDRNAATNAE